MAGLLFLKGGRWCLDYLWWSFRRGSGPSGSPPCGVAPGVAAYGPSLAQAANGPSWPFPPLRNASTRPAQVAFCVACTLAHEKQSKSCCCCCCSSTQISQTTQIATWAQAEWRCRAIGERGRDAEPAPLGQGRPIGAARWRGAGTREPRRGPARSQRFGYFAKAK